MNEEIEVNETQVELDLDWNNDNVHLSAPTATPYPSEVRIASKHVA